MKRTLLAVALFALAAGNGFAQAAVKAPETAAPKIVANINGEVLTVEELDKHWARLSPEMRANYERAGGKAQFLETYIRKRLLIQEAIKQRYDKSAEGAFDVAAARDAALFDSYIRNVVAKSVISDMDLKDFYEANKNQFKTPEMIHARHILATPAKGNVTNTTSSDAGSDAEALEKMKGIAQKLTLKQASFEQLAAELSEDPGSARSGGDLGWFPRGKMVPEFEDAAFKLRVGDTSHVVKTQFGYHVIRVEAHQQEGFMSFEDVKPQIQERLLQERADKVIAAVNQLTNELRALSSIQVHRENL
ncbi:MAG: peptidylprolyl isomerase [Thermoanaerobaculia bacterium]